MSLKLFSVLARVILFPFCDCANQDFNTKRRFCQSYLAILLCEILPCYTDKETALATAKWHYSSKKRQKHNGKLKKKQKVKKKRKIMSFAHDPVRV